MKSIITLSLCVLFSVSVSGQSNTQCNCCTEKHAEFDFWVGSWTVTDTNGAVSGKNVIKKIQGNCILQENWTSATSSFTGTSNNFYNSKTQQWEQIWLDNQGQSLHMKGQRKGDQMIMRSEDATNKNGQTFYHQITWTKNEDGTVRQLWETFTEGQEEPTVAFDGLYKRDEH